MIRSFLKNGQIEPESKKADWSSARSRRIEQSWSMPSRLGAGRGAPDETGL
jgi:hypothetical protein